MEFDKPVDTDSPEPEEGSTGAAFFALAMGACLIAAAIMLTIKLGLILFT